MGCLLSDDTVLDNMDVDGDQWPSALATEFGWSKEVDCDDSDSTVFPGAVELCDGKDNNCDGEAEEPSDLYADEDGDGHGGGSWVGLYCSDQTLPGGTSTDSDDCDDSDVDVFPNGTEECDGLDNDCNGEVDEGFEQVYGLWYWDVDDDGFGTDEYPYLGCAYVDGNVSAVGGDCDDLDPLTYPGAEEICDGKENDCSESKSEAGLVTLIEAEYRTYATDYTSIVSSSAGEVITVNEHTLHFCEGTFDVALNLTEYAYGVTGFGDVILEPSSATTSVIQYSSLADFYPSLELNNISIRGGTGTLVEGTSYGGGILGVYGYASLTDVTIESNEAEYGGGIALLGFSNLSIGDGDIRSNQAVEQGGGVYIGGSASFSAFATSISENTVTAISPSGFGGGIYAEDTDTDQQVAGFYLADDSLIEGNEANFGGGIAMVGADGTLFGGGIHGNGLAEAAAVGGGVYATSDSYLSMVDVELSQNQAARGGGIHLEHSTLTCDADCLIHEHGGEFSDTDIIEGGGISAVTNSRIVADGYPDPLQGTIDLVDNTAVFGGGLFLQDSSFGCYNCSLEQNSATSTDPDFAPQGGGIYAWSTDPLLRHQTRVAMSYAEMIQNVSDNLGGALYLDGAVADFELTQFKGNVAEFASVAHVKGSVLTSMDSVYAGNHALNSSVFRGIPRDSIIDIASYLRIEGGTIQDNENGSLLGPSVAFVGDDTLFLARSVEIDGHHGESCFEVNGDEARLSLEYSEILQNTHTATGAALVMRHGLASSSSSDWGASGSIDDNLPYDIIFPDTDALPLDDVITDVTCDSAGCY